MKLEAMKLVRGQQVRLKYFPGVTVTVTQIDLSDNPRVYGVISHDVLDVRAGDECWIYVWEIEMSWTEQQAIEEFFKHDDSMGPGDAEVLLAMMTGTWKWE